MEETTKWQLIKKTRTGHRCHGCDKTIAAGSPALTTITIIECTTGGKCFRDITYYHNIDCMNAKEVAAMRGEETYAEDLLEVPPNEIA